MRRNPPAKWVLPNTVHPTTSTSWCVPVPDDPFYRAAFWGALQSLGAAYGWQDDDAHTAKQVALVWRDIIDNIKKCNSNQDSKATVIESEDYMSICQQLRVNDKGILQGLCGVDCDTNEPVWEDICGAENLKGSGGQPDPEPAPEPGKKKCWNVTLNANSQWILPVPVNHGDKLTFSEAAGGWSDGTFNWFCPTGKYFVAGGCSGGLTHEDGDPSATQYHMQAIAVLNDDTFYAANTGTVTIPGGVSLGQVVLKANDASPSDNSGSITLKVCLEVAAATTPSVDVTYTYGTGPDKFEAGKYYDLSGSDLIYGNDYLIYLTTSDLCTLQIVSQSGWTPQPGDERNACWSANGGGSFDCNDAMSLVGSTPSNWFTLNSGTAWTVRIYCVSIP